MIIMRPVGSCAVAPVSDAGIIPVLDFAVIIYAVPADPGRIHFRVTHRIRRPGAKLLKFLPLDLPHNDVIARVRSLIGIPIHLVEEIGRPRRIRRQNHIWVDPFIFLEIQRLNPKLNDRALGKRRQ